MEGNKKETIENNDVNDAENDYPSTYPERINTTPSPKSNKDSLEGDRGESEYIPNNEDVKGILESRDLDGIEHEDESLPRKLTEQERDELKEKLGWTDKQLDKCTIDSNGVIHLKTDREDLEGKTSENGVPYERKVVNISGVKIEGVFPEFKSIFDVNLPDDLLKASDTEQFRYCTQQLAQRIKEDPVFARQFTPRQLEQIKNGEPRISGLTWHHNEEPGKMQLVDADTHNICRHTGGKSIWGGGKDYR